MFSVLCEIAWEVICLWDRCSSAERRANTGLFALPQIRTHLQNRLHQVVPRQTPSEPNPFDRGGVRILRVLKFKPQNTHRADRDENKRTGQTARTGGA